MLLFVPLLSNKIMVNKRKISDVRIEELKASPIDLSDIPEITEEMWKTGHLRNWKPSKKSITVRIDLDNLECLKGENPRLLEPSE